MRQLFVFIISILIMGCNSGKLINHKFNSLNGTWIPVQQEFSGTVLPAAAFEKQKLILSDSNYTVIAESVDKGIVKYSSDKFDIYGKEGINSGKHFTAIYKLENNQLTICYNLLGTSYPENFDTKGKRMFFFSVFKKELNK